MPVIDETTDNKPNEEPANELKKTFKQSQMLILSNVYISIK